MAYFTSFCFFVKSKRNFIISYRLYYIRDTVRLIDVRSRIYFIVFYVHELPADLAIEHYQVTSNYVTDVTGPA